MQRTTLIATVLVVVLLLGGAGYYFFSKKSPSSVVVTPPGSSSLPVAGKEPLPSGGNVPTSGSTNTISSPVTVTARLVEISSGPIVPGVAVVDMKSASSSSSVATTTPGLLGETVVKYIERESGNIFSYFVKTKTLSRVSNHTLPGIVSAEWLPDASFAFVRYLSGATFSTINTYALSSAGSGGFFLAQNLADVAVSSSGILTLASGVNGSSVSLSRVDGSRPSALFSTPLTAARISFAGKGQYLVYTKPSSTLPGYAYNVDSSGVFSRVAGPRNGLVALVSPSGKWVLVSSSSDGTMKTELVNTLTRESLSLPLSTIADKCVWTANETSLYCGVPQNPDVSFSYPDDWYQGAVHFSDRIWKVDVANRYAKLVFDFSGETKRELDAESLSVNPLGTVLVFVNKNDGSLWSYSL